MEAICEPFYGCYLAPQATFLDSLLLVTNIAFPQKKPFLFTYVYLPLLPYSLRFPATSEIPPTSQSDCRAPAWANLDPECCPDIAAPIYGKADVRLSNCQQLVLGQDDGMIDTLEFERLLDTVILETTPAIHI